MTGNPERFPFITVASVTDYNIALNKAKDSGEYSFKKICDIDTIKKIISNEVHSCRKIAYLRFYNLKIEIVVDKNKIEDKNILQYCYSKKTFGEWHPIAVLMINDIYTEENIEAIMFENLIGFAKQHGLYWNRNN